VSGAAKAALKQQNASNAPSAFPQVLNPIVDLMAKNSKTLLVVVALIAFAVAVLVSFKSTGNRWPVTDLPALGSDYQILSTARFAEEPAVINFWASWCVACRAEHSLLERLSGSENVPVFGVNHLDQRDDAMRWLGYYGNPFDDSVYDADGRIGRQLGIKALPVSLVVDAAGVIHYRHLGPLDAATIESIILPLIEELRRK
jgi:cytochrome c biogenesis protein CcmG/thiol:disulfide interchange protein DsbE